MHYDDYLDQEMPTPQDGSQEHFPCFIVCQEQMGVSQETKQSRRRRCFHTQTPNHYFAFRAYHFKLSDLLQDLLQREQIFVHRKFCLVLPDFDFKKKLTRHVLIEYVFWNQIAIYCAQQVLHCMQYV